MKLKTERIDLCRVAAEAGELVRPQAEEKGLALKIGYCEDEKDRTVLADPGRVRQIVLNLLTNAVKFTARGSVEVGFERNNGRALVHVTDTGIGIPPELLPRVFEPFYQTEAGLRNRAAGMGLGLAISRDLAVTMGGGLEVTSEQGKGSRFTLWLPDKQ